MWFLTVPFVCALLYAVGFIFVKRTVLRTGDFWGAFALYNWTIGTVFSPFVAIYWDLQVWRVLYQPALIGLLIFTGMFFAYSAIYTGVVSIAVPLFGLKVLFVVLFSRFILGSAIGSDYWIGASLAFCGIFLLQINRERTGGRLGVTLLHSLLSSVFLAFADCLVQHWSSGWNMVFFTSSAFASQTLCSAVLFLLVKRPRFRYSKTDWLWLGGGTLFLVIQAFGMVNAIGFIGDATLVNILYNTRGLWNVLFIWSFGRAVFGSGAERSGNMAMTFRVLGSVLMLSAIIIILR